MTEGSGTWTARWRGGPALMANIISAVARASRREGGSEVWQRIMAGIEAAQFRPDGTPVEVQVSEPPLAIDLGHAGSASGVAREIWDAAARAAGQGDVTLLKLGGEVRAVIRPTEPHLLVDEASGEVRVLSLHPGPVKGAGSETVHSYLGRLAGELADAGAPAVVIERLAKAASAIRAWRDEQVFEVVDDRARD